MILALPLAVLLAGCTTGTRSEANPGSVPQQVVEPEPDYRRIIADSIGQIFAKTAAPRNILVSRARPMRQHGRAAWSVCLRASATSMTGRRVPQRTYVLTIQDQQIIDRREATAESDCAQESYERLVVARSVDRRTPSRPARARR
jgi:hypothetical protein